MTIPAGTNEATDTSAPGLRPGYGHIREAAFGVSPLIVAVLLFGVVLLMARALPDIRPDGPLMRYSLEAFALLSVLVGATITWLAARRGATWDASVWPALLGAVGAFSLLAVLHGTPFAPNGLQGDQAFRTESFTRFADGWALADFTQKDLPAFYAPAYFWILGRIADLTAIEPWRFARYGTIVSAMVVPVIAFLLWRRHVPVRVAVLIAAVPLVVQNWYEPYAWLTIVALVPWWLEVVHGHVGPGTRPWGPVVLGLIGAVLFLTYYYFFFIAAVALVVHLGTEAISGRIDWDRLRLAVIACLVMLLATAVFWVPLVLSILAAEHPQSMANRWFSDSHGVPRLPFLEGSVTGVVSLVGLAYLIVSARWDRLARALLVFLVAAYAWYLIGWPAALLGHPLLTFRGGPVVSMILLIAGILGGVRLAAILTAHPFLIARDGKRVAPLLTALFAGIFLVFAVRSYATGVFTSRHIAAAYDERLPDGQVLRHGGADPAAPYVSIDEISAAIDARYVGSGHPVVLSTRSDVLSLRPYYGFVQWQAFYAHPAAEFSQRIAFLESLAAAPDHETFSRLAADNPFDRIDGYVLRSRGPNLVFEFRDDNFPDRTRDGIVRFPRWLFDQNGFDLVELGDYVVVVSTGLE